MSMRISSPEKLFELFYIAWLLFMTLQSISGPAKELFIKTSWTNMNFKGMSWPKCFAAVLARKAQSINMSFGMVSGITHISWYLSTRYTPSFPPAITSILNHIINLLVKFFNVLKIHWFHCYNFLLWRFYKTDLSFIINFTNHGFLDIIFFRWIIFLFELFKVTFLFVLK